MEPNKDKKLYLLMGVLVIVILIILRSLITTNNDAIINYSDIESGKQLITGKMQVVDREVYYITKNIIANFVNSYSTLQETDDTSFEEYYDVLHKSYKNKLSKAQYIELAEKFISRLEVSDSSGMGNYKYYQTDNIVRSIYEIEDDTYICVVGQYGAEDQGYIGIQLDTYNETYNIFYLE